MNIPFEYILSLTTAAVVVLATVPLWKRFCIAVRLVDAPGERKVHREVIPLVGGLAVLTGILVAGALVLGGSSPIRALVQEQLSLWITIPAGAVMMTLLGVLDDRHVLRPGPKFLLQAAVAVAIAAAGLRVTLFVANPVFQYAATVLWIVTVVNALNFMDNMNGLCAGLGVLAAATFGAAANQHGQHVEAIFSLIVCGALIGFLPYNYPQARVFLGDAGSHLVGYCLAVAAILPSFYTAQDPKPLAVLKPLLILAVPLLDMAWMVIIRTKAGKPFYVGDTNHLSHRLVRRGLNPAGAVALIWVIAACASVLALLL